jgi:hypothetical protein
MKKLKQRLIACYRVIILEISKILALFFYFCGGGTNDKVTAALRFLVLVWHLIVLANQNK